MSEYTYATLQETNIEEHESWLTFIRYQGNEDNLKRLREQLEQVDWHCEEDEGMESAFDLDTDYLVCEKTAKEMTKLDLNAYMPHKKFDGELKEVKLQLKEVSSDLTKKKKERLNDKNIEKINEKLGYGQIEDFLSQEDENSEAEYATDDSVASDDSDDSDDDDSDDETEKPAKRVPPVIEKPRFAKKAQRHNNKKNSG